MRYSMDKQIGYPVVCFASEHLIEPKPGINLTRKCRACESDQLSLYVGASTKGLKGSTDTFYSKCTECGSLTDCANLRSESRYNEKLEEGANLIWTRFYADATAGIDSMLEPMVNMKRRVLAGKVYVGVGCGTGFDVHFAQTVLEMKAVGYEPSSYGVIGAEMLGIRIFQECYSAKSAKESPALVYAAEVIEHVDDPVTFLASLFNRYDFTGCLILTTPNADYIHPKNDKNEIYSCLFPGEHRVIFSRAGLMAVLEKAGFRHIHIETRRNESNIVAYASLLPLDEFFAKNSESFLPNHEDLNNAYIAYLSESTAGPKAVDKGSLFMQSLLYRLAKELVNRGQIDDAIEVLSSILKSYKLDKPSHEANSDRPVRAHAADIISECLSIAHNELWLEISEMSNRDLGFPEERRSFWKNLGFYITTIIQSLSSSEAILLLQAASFLELFVSYRNTVEQSGRPDFFLEYLGLVVPAFKGLILARLKLGDVCERHFIDSLMSLAMQSEPASYIDLLTYKGIFFERKGYLQDALNCYSSAQLFSKKTFGLEAAEAVRGIHRLLAVS